MCNFRERSYTTDGESGQLTYAMLTPRLDISDMEETCSNVEYAPVSKSGKKLSAASAVKILKGNANNNYD
jgi:hypothetical protein